MITLTGSVINPGLSIGKARKISPQTWHIPRLHITQQETDSELKLLQSALVKVDKDIGAYLAKFKGSAADEEILRSHQLILSDPDLYALISNAISQKLESAAQAVQSAFATVVQQFKGLHNDFFAQRAADYQDVANRLLAELLGNESESLTDWQPDQIAVLSEITPSLVSTFAQNHISAYCSEQGSFTSHASILTRSQNIAAVTALAELFQRVNDGDELILDALEGKVVIAPDPPTRLHYEQQLAKYLEQQELLRKHSELPTQTLDGRRIKLRCNLELLSGLDQLQALGADGIGLYRTEFLYLGKDSLPSEEQQFEVYREVAEKILPHSVTIRSFDLGGDKLSHLIPSPEEANPYLGCRGIRFSLAHPEILRTQIRAILRASHFGRIKLMFPMVIGADDFLRAKALVLQCMRELDAEAVSYDAKLPLGVMIEIPSAALCAAELAQTCDFLSIGTNDLVQYTLAADRNNSALAPYYISHHPAVLQLLKLTLQAALEHHKPVSICGEMASLPEYIPLLVGLGFTELSVNSASWLQAKGIIRRCDAALHELIRSFAFNCSVSVVEELIHITLKPYYQV